MSSEPQIAMQTYEGKLKSIMPYAADALILHHEMEIDRMVPVDDRSWGMC